MKATKKYIFGLSYLIIISLVLASCEEVIDITLNDAEPKLTIDGVISLNSPATVKLSYTTSYFADEPPIYETNATIKITNTRGTSEILSHVGNGYYIGQSLLGEVGIEYELSVEVDDKIYAGSSRLMTPTQIVDLSYTKFDGFGSSDEDEYNLEIVLKNNPQEDNYYLVKYYLNGSDKEETYSLWSHEFFPNDELIEFSPLRFSFTKDDFVTVKAYSIDEGTYDYYSQLDEIIDQRGGGSSTPFNPASNLGKGILGYFRAWSFDEKSIQVEDE